VSNQELFRLASSRRTFLKLAGAGAGAASLFPAIPETRLSLVGIEGRGYTRWFAGDAG